MKTLTIVASNRDRLDLNGNATKWLFKSLNNQTYTDFEFLIVDGGSKNIDELKIFEINNNFKFKLRVIKCKLGEEFERAKLNNIGIKNSKTRYVMTTDVDIFFSNKFVATLIDNLCEDCFIQSRTMYWKKAMIDQIYQNEIDPFKNIEKCKRGRIKKRTTAGGCQCAHIKKWFQIRGFDEKMIQWGSEDYDLYLRMKRICKKTIWLGENKEEIMVFHQPHEKSKKIKNLDMKHQNENKKLLALTKQNQLRQVNKQEWGQIL